MPQAVVDPEELRQFAQSLKKFNNGLREQAGALANRLAALSATWRDQEHKKFAEQFETNMKVLVRFTETADQYVPYLLRKAEHIAAGAGHHDLRGLLAHMNICEAFLLCGSEQGNGGGEEGSGEAHALRAEFRRFSSRLVGGGGEDRQSGLRLRVAAAAERGKDQAASWPWTSRWPRSAPR